MEMALSILGILLAVVGLLAFRPQLNASLEEPLDANQPYAPTFKIVNTGLTALTNVRVYGYAARVEVGGVTMTDVTSRNTDWHTDVLERGEAMTLVWNFIHSDAPLTATNFDVALVIEHSPSWMPFYRATRMFRWIGTRTAQGPLRLLPQPVEPIREKAQVAIERAKTKHAEKEKMKKLYGK